MIILERLRMSSVLLSICIPTFNRCAYLRELLPQIIRQACELEQGGRVEILVSDNASSDGTEAYCRSLNAGAITYFRNEVNIGGDRNFLACVDRAKGEYVWLFGDDELIEEEGVSRVVGALIQSHPALVILGGRPDAPDARYAGYKECVTTEMKSNPLFPLAHTLITANVFLKGQFDLEYARAGLFTNYAHMLGLMVRIRNGGTVVVLNRVVAVRPERAQFAHWPFALCVKQAYYLCRIAKWFHVPELYGKAFRSALNLPVECLACLAHKVFPGWGRT